MALHGDGFGSDAEIETLAGDLDASLRIVRVDGSQTLGGVLRAAAEAAGGSLITKMDDDDYYGAEHIWDLVLAHEYSGAELIGKSAEYVYLERLDKTVRDQNRQNFSERYIPFVGVSGGVLMISRHDLDAAGAGGGCRGGSTSRWPTTSRWQAGASTGPTGPATCGCATATSTPGTSRTATSWAGPARCATAAICASPASTRPERALPARLGP